MGKIVDKYTDGREIPLYKATETLLYDVDNLINFLQKDRKHTLGQHMLLLVLDMLDCVAVAYDFPERKVEQLKLYISKYNNLATILKMCEIKGYLMNNNKNYYVEMIKPLGNAYKQAKGWLVSANKEAGVCMDNTESA
jgi:hypothetical protein